MKVQNLALLFLLASLFLFWHCLLYLKNPGETKEGQLYYVVIHFLYTAEQQPFFLFLFREK